MADTPYSRDFFEKIAPDSETSAAIAGKVLVQLIKPESVVDVGCGSGTWLKVLSQLGVSDFLGVDGSYVEQTTLRIPSERFTTSDLRETWAPGRRFDLALSLEVGEHLSPDSAANLVKTLTACADVIAFSAAAPGQMGEDHVNEQWPNYWADLFNAEGYDCLDVLRPALWNSPVKWWYAQNMLLFARPGRVAVGGMPRWDVEGVPPALVHPDNLAQKVHLLEASKRGGPVERWTTAARRRLKS